MIGGGSGIEIPTLTSTLAIVTIGKAITNARKNVPKRTFFILPPPLSYPNAI